MTAPYDALIVGGGIVGLATAREFLRRHPGARVAVLEKESAIGQHQTGHNSGVIHTGIYYKPGSLKARSCVAGHAAMLHFCEERGIPVERCGKLIVALDETELPRLSDLYQRGIANGVQDLEWIGPERIREIEPHVSGIQAIYAPHCAVTDYTQVARAYADDVEQAGGEICTGTLVLAIRRHGEDMLVTTPAAAFTSRMVITCAGLYSDRISGTTRDFRIVPFRGSYYRLPPEKRHLVRGLIYPVPDPRFPFLGVHFTRTISGDVLVGPNAVLAFSREGYSRRAVRPRDLADTLTFGGFWKLARRYWRTGLEEIRGDYSKRTYLATARRYLPSLTLADLLPGPSGVRAQALDADGSLIDDFRIKRDGNLIHVQNAPSPAATASLIIAQRIVDEVQGITP